LFLEDKDYTEIVGDTNLPYINSLINDTSAALFTQSYCTFTGFSQPNYLDFYSGFNQGVTNNLVPSNHPFTTDNLGRQLLDSGKTFVTYAEDLPYTGYNGPSWGAYERKHNPVTNWMGTGINQVPDTLNQPFTAYPSWDFNQLPTITYVVPNNINNMHDGNYPTNFQIADAWIQSNLDSYIQWARTSNSLFILTFDEGNFTNRIVTVFFGPMVQGGQYHDTINHFNILRTIEDMYGLGYAGNAAYVQPITWCWKTTGIKENALQEKISLHPNPVRDVLTLSGNIFKSYETCVRIIDMAGRTFVERHFKKTPDHTVTLQSGVLETGMYLIEVISNGKSYRIKMLKD
jgi:acid phosphatase